ncbi:MAG: protocatechuate 3,4-dioxygenase [Gammaproteobacteria bacterium]|jgi:protocatechuate 3,4-dioxygenase beta subunit|nr:protocatechuate 3,4-dioxygenase [Gammaproteobacteria bacterium]
MNDPVNRRRRRVLCGIAALPVAGLAATEPTPSASEGPFYPPAGMRLDDIDSDLVKVADQVEQAGGEIVTLAGRVLDSRAEPIAGARIEIWQCDVNGRYLHHGDQGGAARDGGFQGYGHDISKADGAFAFRTIKPVPYAGRTPHIHVKVLIENRERLTTQFYLPDHPGNARDWLYRRIAAHRRERVTMRFETTAGWPQAKLDIVV